MSERDRIQTPVRLPAELRKQLQVAAEERGLSMTFLIVKALEDFLPRLVPPEEFRLTRREGTQ